MAEEFKNSDDSALNSNSEEAPDSTPRERILEASLKLFVEQGYFNTNVPDISRQSRCSVGSIYHHFLNKEEIASELYQESIAHFREVLGRSFDPKEDLQHTVYSLVMAFLNYVETHAMQARYLWLARHDEFLSKKVSRPTTVGFDRLGRNLTKVIKSGIRKGEIQRLDAEVIWTTIFGIPLSFVRDWLDGYTKQTPTQVAPIIASACWAAIQGAKSD